MFSLRDQKVNVVFLARVNRIVDSSALSFLVRRKTLANFSKLLRKATGYVGLLVHSIAGQSSFLKHYF